mgnify:CR=1 FL=1
MHRCKQIRVGSGITAVRRSRTWVVADIICYQEDEGCQTTLYDHVERMLSCRVLTTKVQTSVARRIICRCNRSQITNLAIVTAGTQIKLGAVDRGDSNVQVQCDVSPRR